MRNGEPRRSDVAEVAAEPLDRHVADRHEPLLVALADDPNERAVERQVLAVEPQRLRDPDPGRVQELEQGSVTDREGRVRYARRLGRLPASLPGRRLQQPVNLVDRQRLGQPAWLAWQVQVPRHVAPDRALAVRKAVETADRRSPA